MNLALIAVFFVVVILACALSTPGRHRDLSLEVLGFTRSNPSVLRRDGLELRASGTGHVLTVHVKLKEAPAPYDRIARVLGRGDVLASLHALEAQVDRCELTATAPHGLRLRALKRWLEALVNLAQELNRLPIEEALARSTLESGLESGPSS